jgi:Fe2+ transport system protein FeoA
MQVVISYCRCWCCWFAVRLLLPVSVSLTRDRRAARRSAGRVSSRTGWCRAAVQGRHLALRKSDASVLYLNRDDGTKPTDRSGSFSAAAALPACHATQSQISIQVIVSHVSVSPSDSRDSPSRSILLHGGVRDQGSLQGRLSASRTPARAALTVSCVATAGGNGLCAVAVRRTSLSLEHVTKVAAR